VLVRETVCKCQVLLCKSDCITCGYVKQTVTDCLPHRHSSRLFTISRPNSADFDQTELSARLLHDSATQDAMESVNVQHGTKLQVSVEPRDKAQSFLATATESVGVEQRLDQLAWYVLLFC